jgi:hypothetical protein
MGLRDKGSKSSSPQDRMPLTAVNSASGAEPGSDQTQTSTPYGPGLRHLAPATPIIVDLNADLVDPSIVLDRFPAPCQRRSTPISR